MFCCGDKNIWPVWRLPEHNVTCCPSQVTFAWPGFNNAMASNVGMVVRNILSKKLMGGYKVWWTACMTQSAHCRLSVCRANIR